MKRIGVISDTHGLFDEPLREFLAGVDVVWHAGDFGSIEVADAIAAFKPLKGVRGNIDGGSTRLVYPEFNSWECEGARVLMTHQGGRPGHYNPFALERIRRVKPAIFVAGHSHILNVRYDRTYNLLFINPGAAGVSGFHNIRTAVRFTLDAGVPRDMELGEWPK